MSLCSHTHTNAHRNLHEYGFFSVARLLVILQLNHMYLSTSKTKQMNSCHHFIDDLCFIIKWDWRIANLLEQLIKSQNIKWSELNMCWNRFMGSIPFCSEMNIQQKYCTEFVIKS